jgi:glutathione S-transferase
MDARGARRSLPAGDAAVYLKIDPQGTVPLLVDGETRMTESAAICQYLASVNAPTSLDRRQPQAAEDYAQFFFVRLRALERLLGRVLGHHERFGPAVQQYWKRLSSRAASSARWGCRTRRPPGRAFSGCRRPE